MDFRKRLVRYLLGVAIGLVVVYLFFGDRDWTSWTPESRVLRDLRDSHLAKTEKAQCLMECLGISDAAVKTLLVDGDVVFDESRPREIPRMYVVKSDQLEAHFELKDSLATLILVKFRESEMDCPCP